MLDYFLYDHLRADGFMVRWCRLNMVSTEAGAIYWLCWFMEITFAVAYFTEHKRASCVAFWLAYLAINLMV